MKSLSLSITVLIVVLLLSLTIVYGQTQVRGGGSTLGGPLADFIAKLYTETNPTGDVVTFSSVGSAKGLENLIARRYQYAITDIDIDEVISEAHADIDQIPMMASPIALVYNIPEAEYNNYTSMVLDREVTAGIFSGYITMWNDEKIQQLNPEIKLPAKEIRVIVRSDVSGSTHILTHALTSFSQEFAEEVGNDLLPNWPDDFIRAQGSQGVSKTVFLTPYSISYLSLRNANLHLHNYAMMKNKAGNVVKVSVASALQAVNDFSQAYASSLSVKIVDGSGAQSWPITGFTYFAYRPTNMTDCTKALALQKYFEWLFEARTLETMTTANELIQENFFVPNIAAINKRLVKAHIYEMKCNGVYLDLGLKPLRNGAIGFGFFVLLCFVIIVITAIIWFIKFKLSEIIASRFGK